MANLIKKILLPTDNSENSAEAFKLAISLAKQNSAELHVVSVANISCLEEARKYESEPLRLAPQFIESLIRETTKETDKFIKKFAKNHEGLKIEKSIRKGTPFVEIIIAARKINADLIVMGTHGRTGLSHVMIGSVAEKVVRKAPCSVLTVKPRNYKIEAP